MNNFSQIIPISSFLAFSTCTGLAFAQNNESNADGASANRVGMPADSAKPSEPNRSSIDETRELGLLFGLLQPILTSGGNVQLEATVGRFVFDYSHGFSLDIPAAGNAQEQDLALHLPYSTGLGIGYRLTENFDLRLEPKLHQYEIRYATGAVKDERITRYKTATLGLGAYYKWRPFKSGAASGITVAPSLRFWPNVWSSLDGGELSYENLSTGRREVHETQNIGLANTPLIINLSVGYAFAL